MDHEEMRFEEFLAARMREKGVSMKRLGEITGIAPAHLENLLRGSFEAMPSAPYFRGYVIRVGKALDFDGEEWWKKIKSGERVKDAGPSDMLPRNRFIKKEMPKTPIIFGIVAVFMLIYALFQFQRIAGRPSLTVTNPPASPFTSESNTFTITGKVANADSLSLNGDMITINADGTWQKGVLLQSGVNTFAITAKKFLGGEANVNEEIIYESASTGASSPSSNARYPTIHVSTGTPATGTFFN